MNFADLPNTHLPEQFHHAHQLVLTIHDVLLQQYLGGLRDNAFVERGEFDSLEEWETVVQNEHPIDWFLRTQPEKRSVSLLTKCVYPAVLSDFLHFVYEAMECSRKGKLPVAFSLLRKPLCENLLVIELIAADPKGFSERFQTEVSSLYPRDAEREKPHDERIREALEAVKAETAFDPAYVEQLRYTRASEDSFAGLFDKAIHLVTGFSAIATEPMNLNFVYSDASAMLTQWSYIYSRLPYLMAYTYQICECIFARFIETDPRYLEDMGRRIDAGILLCDALVSEAYRCPQLDEFADEARNRLNERYQERGYQRPTTEQLEAMFLTGSWPDD